MLKLLNKWFAMPEQPRTHPENPAPDTLTTDYAGLLDQVQSESKADQGPIAKTERAVSYLGVELERGTGQEVFVPQENPNYINDPFSLELQKELATAFKLHQPVLLEGGTSLGKTSTAQKMCAELGWSWHYSNNTGSSEVETMMGSYLPNPNRVAPTDPEYVFVDGPVTAAIREAAEGKKVMLVLDELNSTAPNILIRLHEVMDAYEKNQILTLSEDANEKLQLVRENLCIVGLTNPPSRGGSGYLAREPLDPAQLRRWVYLKLPDELPPESMSYATRGLFGLETPTAEVSRDKYRASATEPLYEEFHRQAKGLLKERHIAGDQPQRFTYDDREEPRRVMEFVQNFYQGDINETFQDALRYFYSGKLLDPADKAKLDEVIKTVHYVPRVEVRRRGLETAPARSGVEPWAFSDEMQQSLATMFRGFYNSGEVPAMTLAEGLAGVTVEDAQILKDGYIGRMHHNPPDAAGRSLAGDGSEAAVPRRDLLVRQERWPAVAESLVGLDNLSSTVLVHGLLEKAQEVNHPDLYNAIMVSRAGLDSDEAWADRAALWDKAKPAAYVLSTTGLDSARAWEVRESIVMRSRANIDSLGMSMAGLDSDRAWEMRYGLLQQEGGKAGDAVALSLAGLDSEEAWALRTILLTGEGELDKLTFRGLGSSVPANFFEAMSTGGRPPARPGTIAQSLGGLMSPEAQDWRTMLQNVHNVPNAAIAKSYNGNWVIAGVKLAERQARS